MEAPRTGTPAHCSPGSLAGAKILRVGAGSRLAKPSRSDARKGGLDAAAGSGTMDRRGRRHHRSHLALSPVEPG